MIVELMIKVFDKKGKLIEKRYSKKCLKGDLILNNWKELLACILTNQTLKRYASLVSEGGIARDYDLLMRTTGAGSSYIITEDKISIGTGVTPPSRNDYALASKYAETTSVSIYVGADYFTLSASIVLSVGADISEVGYSINWAYSWTINAPSYDWFMIFRDVIDPPVSVPDGGTIVLTERVTL